MYGQMKINQDKVPINLDDAVATLREGMSPEDIAEFKSATFSPQQLHFGLGMMLRNEWSLWEKETILVRWFKEKYGVDHADDVSGLILDCLYQDVLGKPRRDEKLAKQYIAHWKKQKNK
jgi:hypothetical protein